MCVFADVIQVVGFMSRYVLSRKDELEKLADAEEILSASPQCSQTLQTFLSSFLSTVLVAFPFLQLAVLATRTVRLAHSQSLPLCHVLLGESLISSKLHVLDLRTAKQRV